MTPTQKATRLLANARYYEAEAKKPENADMAATLLASAKTARAEAVKVAMEDLCTPAEQAREEATLRRAYRKMK